MPGHLFFMSGGHVEDVTREVVKIDYFNLSTSIITKVSKWFFQGLTCAGYEPRQAILACRE